jgi:hypothetical protein
MFYAVFGIAWLAIAVIELLADHHGGWGHVALVVGAAVIGLVNLAFWWRSRRT